MGFYPLPETVRQGHHILDDNIAKSGLQSLRESQSGYKTSKIFFFLRSREIIDNDKFSKVNVLRKGSLEAEVGRSFILMKVKEESEKVDLKLNIQKTKTMASSPITSWQIDGETVADFIVEGSKIAADGDSSHKIKRYLLLGRKVMTNLDSIFKSRDIILPTKVRLVKAMVFPVVMYGCESWTINKAEHQRIDAFEL